MKKLTKGIGWVILAGILVYFLLAIYADLDEFIGSFSQFNLIYIPIILFCTLANYHIRFIKWHYLLKPARIKIPRKLSYMVFMAGLAGTISPAKSGEFIKPLLLKTKKDIPFRNSFPVFFFERLTDLIGISLLSLIGIHLTNWNITTIILIILGVFLILFLLTNPLFWTLLFGLLGKQPKSGPFKLILDISQNIQIFWKFKVITLSVALSVFSWFFECLGFYLVIRGFGLEFNLLTAISIFAFSSLLGALTLIPGALGIMDGSLTALLQAFGIAKAVSVASTFIIRGFTLWFAVLIGLLFLFKIQGGLDEEEQFNIDSISISSNSNTGSDVGTG